MPPPAARGARRTRRPATRWPTRRGAPDAGRASDTASRGTTPPRRRRRCTRMRRRTRRRGSGTAGTAPPAQYLPFQTRDGAFVAAFSYNAGVGEEALFRGWLYPMLYQHLGRRAWLANGLQAGAFGALHAPQAGAFALDIAGSALYEGWLTRRNGWSI